MSMHLKCGFQSTDIAAVTGRGIAATVCRCCTLPLLHLPAMSLPPHLLKPHCRRALTLSTRSHVHTLHRRRHWARTSAFIHPHARALIQPLLLSRDRPGSFLSRTPALFLCIRLFMHQTYTFLHFSSTKCRVLLGCSIRLGQAPCTRLMQLTSNGGIWLPISIMWGRGGGGVSLHTPLCLGTVSNTMFYFNLNTQSSLKLLELQG